MDGPFSLTSLQQAYWVGQGGFAELGNVYAHVYREFECEGLDLAAANRALQQLIARHEALRVVVRQDGQQQVLRDVPEYRVEAIDLRSKPREEIERTLDANRDRGRITGPATDTWPLFDIRCHQIDDHEYNVSIAVSLLVLDAHTEPLLLADWLAFYGENAAGPPALEEDPGYRDAIESLRPVESSDEYREAWDYWDARLATLPAAPELPLATAPESLPAGAALCRRDFRLDPATWRAFKELAARAHLTPSTALCAAYCEVIAGWSTNRRFTLNMLVSRRMALGPEAHRLAGNFGSTLPLEVDCTGTASLLERALELRDQLWDDVDHAEVSGVDIVREAARRQGVRGRAALPVVFASALELDNSVLEELPFTARVVDSALQTPQVYLDHQAFEYGGALVANWDSVDEAFSDGFLDAAFAAYRDLVRRLATDEAAWRAPLAELLRDPDAPAIEQVWLAQDPPVLHAPFLERAAQQPDAIAVIGTGTGLTYRELAGRASGVAEWLTGRGIGPGDLVPVVMHKGWEQVVAVLGTLLTGAAYLPVDAALPASRISYLLGQVNARVALAQTGLPSPGLPHCHVGECPAAALPVGPGPATAGSLAYVIYTSGSTGHPKGVAIDHRGAANTIHDVNERFGVGVGDRVLAMSSLSFDLSVYDVFGILAAGGTIVIPDRDRLRDPRHWLDLLDQHQITVWNSVPALMDLLVRQSGGRSDAPSAPLRLVMLSGDWIPVTLPDAIRRHFRDAAVVSLGGATEASIWSICYPIGEVDDGWRSIPYGHAMEHQRVYVMDDALEIRPAWAVGELYIGGVGVARCYWGDEQLTADRFVTHPRTGARLYRTGDFGRYLPSGEIEFLGRKDNQVKIQGYRIELGEIESAIQRHPGIKEVVVDVHESGQDGRSLVAYIVPVSEDVDTAGLRAYLGGELPSYMVPSVYIALETIPLTGNGKIDRHALPEPGTASPRRSSVAVRPRDALERSLHTIWSNVLNAESLGVEDDFFETGGNSFTAMRLMARVQADLGLDLPLSALFEGPTIGRLADVIRQQPDAATETLVPIRTGGSQPPLYFAHPVGGNVLCYSELARILGDDQPFYGLQSRDPATYGDHPPTVEGMARDYADAIAAGGHRGPGVVGGWSMGGLLAVEMARELLARDYDVPVVILVDSPEPGDDCRTDHVVDFLADVAGRGQLDAGALDTLARRPELGSPLEVATWLRQTGLLPADADVRQTARLLETFTINSDALGRYRSAPLPTRLEIIVARGGIGGAAVSSWAEIAAGHRVHQIDGDHYSIMRQPDLAGLARQVQRSLEG